MQLFSFFLLALIPLCSSQECSKWRDGPCGVRRTVNFDGTVDVEIFVLTDGEGNLEATGSSLGCAYSGSTTYEIDDDCNLLMDWELEDCVLVGGTLVDCFTPQSICRDLPTSVEVTDDDCIGEDEDDGEGDTSSATNLQFFPAFFVFLSSIFFLFLKK
mmetsp:Transcript_32013/g.43851  ORF Transcript_32013/g.43851 Transcript_32013/m.43851 type:complete len:158 (+) Transcript_32013:69-542(+)